VVRCDFRGSINDHGIGFHQALILKSLDYDLIANAIYISMCNAYSDPLFFFRDLVHFSCFCKYISNFNGVAVQNAMVQWYG